MRGKIRIVDDIVGRLRSLFPPQQLDVVIGSLLGDARLECRSKGIRANTARFRVHHGYKQKKYVFWKYRMLEDLVSRMPRSISWTNKKRDLKEVSWYFHTRSSEEFGILHKVFYREGVKILPQELFPVFTDRMLAVWFMDDGSNNGHSLTLNTHSLPLEDQRVIAQFFEGKYGIHPTIVKDRVQWKLAIGANDLDSFLSIIEPFVPQCMSYKIASPRNDLSTFGFRPKAAERIVMR